MRFLTCLFFVTSTEITVVLSWNSIQKPYSSLIRLLQRYMCKLMLSKIPYQLITEILQSAYACTTSWTQLIGLEFKLLQYSHCYIQINTRKSDKDSNASANASLKLIHHKQNHAKLQLTEHKDLEKAPSFLCN